MGRPRRVQLAEDRLAREREIAAQEYYRHGGGRLLGLFGRAK